MKMVFYIQLSNPSCNKITSLPDYSLREIVEDVFQEKSEEAFLCWNSVRIPLSYKYDISLMIDDIINMLLQIKKKTTGAIRICWPSSDFRSDWDLRWSNNLIEISAIWHSITGGLEKVLQESPEYSGDLNSFVSEWMELLKQVEKSIEYSGIDRNNIEEFKVLIREALCGYKNESYLYS